MIHIKDVFTGSSGRLLWLSNQWLGIGRLSLAGGRRLPASLLCRWETAWRGRGHLGGKYRKVESNYLKVIFVRCRLTHRPPVQLDFLLRWAPEWLLQGSALGRQASNRSVDVIAEVGGAETAVNAGVAGLGDVPHVAALRQLEGIPEVPEEDGDGEALAELSYFDKVC